MKNIVALALATAGLANAQAVYGADGTFTCTLPNAAYCAGSSLGTDIIIRCNGTVGQPGRCGNNLAGQPPLGSGGALCYQTSPEAGDAACEKNCVVYAPSSTFTLAASLCTPTYTATTQSLSTTIIIETPHPTNSLSTTTIIETVPTTKKTSSTACTESLSTTIIVEPIPTSTKKTTAKTTDTTCTESLSTTIIVEPIPTSTKSYTPTNGTLTRSTTTFITTPTGANRPPPVTAGAVNNKAMGGLAVVGLAAAYLL